MVFPLTYIFRKKGLKKYASHIQTGMVPLSAMRSAFILLDAEDKDKDGCISSAGRFFRPYGIKTTFFHIDTRRRWEKKGSDGSDPAMTMERKDLNWYGRPVKKLLQALGAAEYDLYIDLTSREDYTVVFLSHMMPAKFKIGCVNRKDIMANLTVTAADSSAVTSSMLFKEISAMLVSIK